MAGTLYFQFQKKWLCVGFLKCVPSFALLREWVNEYLEFGEAIGSKNKIFTNRKKIINCNKK